MHVSTIGILFNLDIRPCKEEVAEGQEFTLSQPVYKPSENK